MAERTTQLVTEQQDKLFALQHHRFAETKIGDENSLSFRPAFRVRRWGDEGSFFVRLPTTRNVTPTRTATEVLWLDSIGNLGFRAYGFEPDARNDLGQAEIEILLLARPQGAHLELPFETSGMQALYQPELTPLEQARNAFRPDNVIDSYAFYHATRTPFHQERGAAAKYLTGKAFHLYRLKAVDALGDTHWVSWQYDQDRSLIVVTFDNWFRAAQYPVTIDPTIGYTTIGGSDDFTEDYILANLWTASESGAANPGTFFVYGYAASGTVQCLGGVYPNTGNPPPSATALQSATASMTLTTTAGWFSAAITWTGITASTGYWIAINNENPGHTYYDAGGVEGAAAINDHNGTWLDPSPSTWTFPDWDNRVSMYVDYAASTLSFPPPRHASQRALLVR